MSDLEELFALHGVKITANRLLIAQALQEAGRPLSMTELEERLETIDKSNVFRALTVFRDAHLVHALEDSGDGVRYELCHSHGDAHDDDIHVHFYCIKCHRTYCLYDTHVPPVQVPKGYEAESVSYLVKGICPDCRR